MSISFSHVSIDNLFGFTTFIYSEEWLMWKATAGKCLTALKCLVRGKSSDGI